MSARPQPSASRSPHPAFERRMLTRPDTHDTVGTPPLERFRCLDIGGGLILSRAACASRFVATTRDGRSAAVGSQSLAMGPCRGCPVGKLHAAEQRAGTLVSITSGQSRGTVAKPGPSAGVGRHGSIRPGSYATRPEPTVEAPAAVVPAKRPSVAPAAPVVAAASACPCANGRRPRLGESCGVVGCECPVATANRAGWLHDPAARCNDPSCRCARNTSPVPSSAGAQAVVTPADGTDRAEPERAPVSPVEIADPPLSPPAVPVVSTGQRPPHKNRGSRFPPGQTLKCHGCGKTCERTGPNQHWCPGCKPTPAQQKAAHRAKQRESTPERERRYISVAPKVERSTPVLAPERPTTSVRAVDTSRPPDGRVATSTPVPHLDALAAELLDLAIGVVQARAVRDEAAARHDEAAARHDRLVREYRARVAAVVNGEIREAAE